MSSSESSSSESSSDSSSFHSSNEEIKHSSNQESKKSSKEESKKEIKKSSSEESHSTEETTQEEIIEQEKKEPVTSPKITQSPSSSSNFVKSPSKKELKIIREQKRQKRLQSDAFLTSAPEDQKEAPKNPIHRSFSNPMRDTSLKEAQTTQDRLDLLRKTQHEVDPPTHPIQVRMENLGYEVKVTEKTGKPWEFWKKESHWKPLLQNITATVNPGQMLAIMGSSGAGKTTLLNVLSGRAAQNSSARLTGTLLFNGKERTHDLRHQQAFIAQDDILMPTLTVREILEFAAALRLDDSYSSQQKKERVDELIRIFNLKKSEQTMVGAPGLKRGISGGERKRLSVAQEVINDPALLFVDEPTSGLDSTTAELVMSTLRLLAESGRTVICTIHQPNSALYALFDILLLLAKGQQVYFGRADRVVEYFAEIGYQTPKYTNPPDYFIKLTHIDHSSEKSLKRVNKLIDKYKESEAAKTQESVEIMEGNTTPFPGEGTSIFTQMRWLFWRTGKDLWREPLKTRVKLSQTLILGLLIGFVYWMLGTNQESVQDRQGSLYFLCINQAMLATVSTANLFPLIKPIFFRETSNNMYSPTAFYLVQCLTDFPFTAIFTIIISSITYFMIDFRPGAGPFFIFMMILTLTALVGGSLGLLIGIVAPDGETATALVPIFVLPFAIFSGFFINSASAPPYFMWLPWLSFINYAFRALILNEFNRDITFTCKDSELLGAANSTMRSCPIENGHQVIENLNFDDGLTILINVIILCGMIVFYRFFSYLILMWKSRTAIDA